MDDKKLRERALTKVKAKIPNLTLQQVISYVIWVLPFLLFGSRGALWALALFAAKFISLMFSCAGSANVSVDAWRHSSATWGDFIAAFRSTRVLKALCVPFIITSALFTFAGTVDNGIAASLLILALSWVFEYAARWIAYYAFIKTDAPAAECVKGGLAALKGGLARIIKMELILRLWMWVFSFLVGLFCYYALNAGSMISAIAAVFFMASFRYAIGGYNALAQAGQAKSVISGTDIQD